jgi:hypothetical protein
MLKTPSCNEGEITLPFLAGTQPAYSCDLHGGGSWSSVTAFNTMRGDTLGMNDALLSSLSMPSLPEDLFPSLPDNRNQNNRMTNRNSRNNANNRRPSQTNRNSGSGTQNQDPISWSFNNPLLDGNDMYIPPVDMPPENDIPEEHIGYSHGQLNTVAADAEIPAAFPPEMANSGAAAYNVLTHNPQDEDFGYELEIPPYNPLLD